MTRHQPPSQIWQWRRPKEGEQHTTAVRHFNGDTRNYAMWSADCSCGFALRWLPTREDARRVIRRHHDFIETLA